MNFDSAFFLFCFLPVLVILYAVIPGNRARNILLLILGLIFYSFGQLSGLVLVIVSAVVNYIFGLLIMKSGKGGNLIKVIGVAANLIFLGAYKYLNFFMTGILNIETYSFSLTAPIGISFFTFKAISYLIDTCRDKGSGTKNPLDFLLYLSFFPQIMAGPITRFKDFAPQLKGRRPSITGAAAGFRRFIFGLAKKLIISAALGSVADEVFGLGSMDFRLAWLGAIAYMLQIFFDFAGYSDMAIGLGEIFGFTTPENFDYPYIANSITDFWRRWHISLSTWFKDYLYIPLGGNRRGKYRTALNKIIVFALCGLWHGAAWTFIIWGLWQGLLSAVESLKIIDVKKLNGTKPGRVAAHIYTLLAVCLGFVIFRGGTLSQGFGVIGAMFGGFDMTVSGTVLLHTLLNAKTVFIFVIGILLSTPISRRLTGKISGENIAAASASYVISAALFALCIMELASGGFTPFIYFQF